MPSPRRLRAVFTAVARVDADARSPGSPPGVTLCFAPRGGARLDVDVVEDFAPLGPELDIDVVAGLGKVLRLLRAARIKMPGEPEDWLNRGADVEQLLERAIGTAVIIEVKPRSRVRFTAWTDQGVQNVDDVSDVLEAPDAWLVIRRSGRFPVRVERESVVRQVTQCERWYEVVEIARG